MLRNRRDLADSSSSIPLNMNDGQVRQRQSCKAFWAKETQFPFSRKKRSTLISPRRATSLMEMLVSSCE